MHVSDLVRKGGAAAGEAELRSGWGPTAARRRCGAAAGAVGGGAVPARCHAAGGLGGLVAGTVGFAGVGVVAIGALGHRFALPLLAMVQQPAAGAADGDAARRSRRW